MKGVPCGPLIRPFGPPSPRWGEEGSQAGTSVIHRTLTNDSYRTTTMRRLFQKRKSETIS
ncbi:hypothetical protein E0I74_27860 [Rhizobium laguerreae]|nr:hypothetical protein [Rhizobium laguerreae]NKM64913.1 hypothetical protein [Rhizobium leguminosarum bv. viciae]NKM29046.1 hypothetical protein [Rhizobium laguerreae]NKN05972.1 hypothetical protein [Rhizobium laguerreae]TBX74093.1 hypothetical protein E0I74_27860 [Rhizobium laguerreae]